METTERTDLTEEDVADAMYDSLNTKKKLKSNKETKEENYSEIGNVS